MLPPSFWTFFLLTFVMFSGRIITCYDYIWLPELLPISTEDCGLCCTPFFRASSWSCWLGGLCKRWVCRGCMKSVCYCGLIAGGPFAGWSFVDKRRLLKWVLIDVKWLDALICMFLIVVVAPSRLSLLVISSMCFRTLVLCCCCCCFYGWSIELSMCFELLLEPYTTLRPDLCLFIKRIRMLLLTPLIELCLLLL